MQDSRHATQSTDAWEECPPGLLSRYAARQSRAASRQQWLRAGVGGVALGCLLMAVVYWRPLATESSPVGLPSTNVSQRISCQDVLIDATVEEYLAQRRPPAESDRIRKHLRYCQHCREEYARRAEELGQELIVRGPAESSRILVATK